MKRRVVITGAGVVSAVGNNLDEFWDACINLRSNIQNTPTHWANYWKPNSHYWSPLPLLDYSALGFKKFELLQHDEVTLNALLATREAIGNSELQLTPNPDKAGQMMFSTFEPHRVGVFMGTGVGGVRSLTSSLSNNSLGLPTKQVKLLLKKIRSIATLPTSDLALHEMALLLENEVGKIVVAPRFNPFVIPRNMPNAIAASIGIKYNALGKNNTSCVACASGTFAIGEAYQSIVNGDVDIAFAGGSEYLDEPTGALFRSFDEAKTLTDFKGPKELCVKPFDRNRSGFLFSQGGAAVLTIENYESAISRNAPILAEIIGYAESFDAHHLMAPKKNGQQLKSMLKKLLHTNEVATEDIDYINTHGTSTQLNDEVESEVIEGLFGHGPVINSTKGILGHTIGASGAFEAVITALTLKNQKTHANMNLDNPIRPLNFARQTVNQDFKLAISQSLAFGGHNAALLLAKV